MDAEICNDDEDEGDALRVGDGGRDEARLERAEEVRLGANEKEKGR
jgi:hypothetical protein